MKGVFFACLGCVCLLGAGALSAAPAFGDSSIHGYYAWGQHPHGIVKVPLREFGNRDFKRRFWEVNKKLYLEGQRRFMIMELMFSHCKRGSRVPEIQLAQRELAAFFDSGDGVQTYPELLYAVVPSEEHRLQDVPDLNGIYDLIKGKWKVPVFQWLSEPLTPPADLKADGWVFDAYSVSGEAFYRHCQQFMLTGKPVFPVLWAAEPGMDGYYPEGLSGMLENIREKSAICRELDLPMFWFTVCKQHGSVNCWMSDKPGFPELRAKVEACWNERRKEPTQVKVPIQNFALTPAGDFVWQEDFKSSALVERCVLRGGHRARVTPEGLRLNDEATALSWQFRFQDSCTQGRLCLQFEGQPPRIELPSGETVAQSGKEIEFPLAGRTDCPVRIWGRNVTLKNLKIAFVGQPASEKQLKLTVQPDGTVEFRENLGNNLFRSTVETSSAEQNIRFYPKVAVIMGSSWEGRQKLVFSEPVRKISVTVGGYADYANWRCSVEASLSRDGHAVTWMKSNPKRVYQKLQLECSDPVGMKECYLHVKLTNGSGVYPRGGAPARLFGYVIKGTK